MAAGDSPGKLTKDAKAMIQLAFEDLGGLPRLVEWANNPTNLGQFYTQIWSKIIPKDIKAEMDHSITIEVVRYGDEGDYALKQGGNQMIMHTKSLVEDTVLDESREDEDEDTTSE